MVKPSGDVFRAWDQALPALGYSLGGCKRIQDLPGLFWRTAQGLEKTTPVLLSPPHRLLGNGRYPDSPGGIRLFTPKKSLGASCHPFSVSNRGNWAREHKGELSYLTAHKWGSVGRLSQSYLLESIFLSTLNGQATG